MYILAKENAIQDWRNLMGPTKVFKTQFDAPESIRGKFGLSDTRNCAHGSGNNLQRFNSSTSMIYQTLDSPQSVQREIGVVFPEFNIEKWYTKDEPYFRKGEIEFIENMFCHLPMNKDVLR